MAFWIPAKSCWYDTGMTNGEYYSTSSAEGWGEGNAHHKKPPCRQCIKCYPKFNQNLKGIKFDALFNKPQFNQFISY